MASLGPSRHAIDEDIDKDVRLVRDHATVGGAIRSGNTGEVV
jgi:hypothetical protein